ncbi:DNA polymerase epsilon subunit 2 [Chrysoperla carnea]|uniref:DNA polymerase epsilon subunit 2 n=1 Tax=Chrysoperla carnea TaxID=189513 RepID=UPI001D08C27F|nr:DNA polymerase epsilon subunit 2 [Chrysoperla carnea]
MMDYEKYKKKVQNAFKLSGYSIKTELCKIILENWNDEIEFDQWIDAVIDNIQNLSLSHSNLTENDIETAVRNSLRSGQDDTETVLTVINAFDTPKFSYDIERKKFVKDDTKNLLYFPNADAKSELFTRRYTIILQRVLRNELFKPTLLGDKSQDVQLSSIEQLLSAGNKKKNAIVLGLLTQVNEGKWFIEDPTGILQLDLTNARYHVGLFTENCIVLCDGTFEEKTLIVQGMAHPPVELSIDSREYFNDINTFGGPSKTSLKFSKRLSDIEKKNQNGIIFISDVWLDKIEVLQKLKVFFQGFNDVPPIAFVFMGNFLSNDKGCEKAYELKTLFKGLGELISRYQNLIEQSTFIFVPGKNDPNAANILPRASILDFITEDFRKKVPKSIFTTNPCRIQYCTQEIVVIREDLLTKMFRNTIHFPEHNDNIADHFTKTILGQGHLSPFTLNVLPVYWSYDYALSLYPLPDLIVVGDKFKAFTQSYRECDVINPGPFSTNDYSFKVYYPATKEIDDSYIPADL